MPRACPHKSALCKRGSVNVRFGPKATELLHRSETDALCHELTLPVAMRGVRGNSRPYRNQELSQDNGLPRSEMRS